MLEDNIYNIDREFDYPTIKAVILKSLERIAKEETLKKRAYFSLDRVSDFKDNLYPNDVKLLSPPTPLLKLKIRNTTKYLNWRIAVLKRDNFTCQICRTSVKANKSLRLEVHHPKAFDEICKENNVSTVEQALGCEELWDLKNGVSICYRCHKDIEAVRTKLRNMFRLENVYT
jgi:5-methylcytosine-specific restriction endonuclease McrA